MRTVNIIIIIYLTFNSDTNIRKQMLLYRYLEVLFNINVQEVQCTAKTITATKINLLLCGSMLAHFIKICMHAYT